MSLLRHWFSVERWGGGGGRAWTTFLSYSVNVCIKVQRGNENSEQTRLKPTFNNLSGETTKSWNFFLNLATISEYHEAYELRKNVMDYKTVGDFIKC